MKRPVRWRDGAALLLLALVGVPRLADADGTGLRLLFVTDAAPFSSVGGNGAPEGYAVAICERIAAALRPGATPSWRGTAIKEGLDLLEQNEADLLCGPVSNTVMREQNVEFSSPIAVGGVGAVLRRGAPGWLLRVLRIGGAGAVTPRALLATSDWPRRVAVLRGSTSADWLNSVLVRTDVVAVQVADYDEAARRLGQGDVGAWVGEWTVLSQRVKSDPRLADMTLIPRPIVGEPLAIAVRSDPALHRSVQATLSTLLRGPELDVMAARWFGQAGREQVSVIQSVTPPAGSSP